MTAGNNLIGDSNDQSGRGGVGTPGNFLEINVDANGGALGILNVTDIASDTHTWLYSSVPFDPANTGTFGVFLTETTGDMKIGTVKTQGDVTLATVAGSLVDARGVGGIGADGAGVIGNTINLFATGGNIGDPSGGNDLEIDSQAYGYGTVGARATGSIDLAEALPTTSPSTSTPRYPQLRERCPGRPASGAERRSSLHRAGKRGPGRRSEPSASGHVLSIENSPETLTHGLINTVNGSVLLRVGDNVTTDPNSQILASKNVDIYGDFRRINESSSGALVTDIATPDDTPQFGTIMHLHGVIAHGATASGYLTRIFGNADTDQIFFDQTFLG